MTLYSNYFIDALRKRNPTEVVLSQGKLSITAKDLLDKATTLALNLKKEGVKKGDKVVLAMAPNIEFLIVFYANMKIGAFVSIIDPEMGNENYQNKFKQFAPNYAFVDSRLIFLNEHPILKTIILWLNKSIPTFPKTKKCKLFTTGLKLPIIQKNKHVSCLYKKLDPVPIFENIDEDEDFLITYTSGTLSEPKGVVHKYRSISMSIQHLAELLCINRDCSIATHLPHYALLGITAGVNVHLWSNKMNALQKIDFIKAHKISTLFGPPSDFIPIIDFLKSKSEYFPTCIKSIYLGSAPIYNSFLNKLLPLTSHIKTICLYGMTEHLMTTFIDVEEKIMENLYGDMVGYPFPKVELKIDDDNEVYVCSKQLFSEYWKLGVAQEFHPTGDLGKIDEKGRLHLLGRKKDMIIRRNFNIYPGLYEPTIHKIDGVKEAVMIGVYNIKKEDEEIILVIEGKGGLSEKKIMKLLENGAYSIDKESLPDKIIFMNIPHSGRQNKVDRKLLREQIKQLNN